MNDMQSKEITRLRQLPPCRALASSPPFLLLPVPREVKRCEQSLLLRDERLILLDVEDPQALHFTGSRFQEAMKTRLGLTWELNASPAAPSELIGLTLRLAPYAIPQPQGYYLKIGPEGILLEGHDEAGIFYGVCTLNQILQMVAGNVACHSERRKESIEGLTLPCLEIRDWPDFPARGVMLDVSRDKVPQMQTLFDLVDRLASWKVNQVQLYTEHTFAYRNHPEVWAEASPLTGEEIMALDAYCRERYVELVPNQNSFGHMVPWLTHERYAPLAETHGEIKTPWEITIQGPFGLAPENPDSLVLVQSLYDELLPHFTSRLFNVGCDETIDLCQGASKEACKERGAGRVYLDFLLKLYDDVKARGFTMQFWGDIILHHPELVDQLPKDVIALSWGYEADHPFDEEGAQFAEAGVPFYVCPGTSSWNSLAGRTDNALANLSNAAENGLKHRAVGYLNTDWGDRGHWQVLPVSYLGFAMGAAYSWSLEASRPCNIRALVSQFAFDDPTGAMGKVAYDLGRAHHAIGIKIHNSTPLFWGLQPGWSDRMIEEYGEEVNPGVFRETLRAIDEAIAPLDKAQMARPDADLIKREYRNTARMMRHACKRLLFFLGQDIDRDALREELAADLEAIIEEYRALWLARNRPGGLQDSIARLEALRADYA